MGIFRRKPERFMGLTADELYARQLQIVDIMDGVGLTDSEHEAMITAAQTIIAIRHALQEGGKIDWDLWDR